MMADTEITVSNNGPLRIKGSFTIKDSEGNTYDLAGRDALSLCRCGNSENKPFCDGSHKRVGFIHESKAFALPPPKPKA
jgi:CDGSH-type Zn-finger protein